MLRRTLLAVLPAVLASLALVAPAPAAGQRERAGACAGGAGLTRTALTHGYRFALHIGMPERMYTPAQVKKLHPKSGEVMMGGAMMAGGMTMGGTMRHVELQICSRKTGTLLTNAHPTITVLDTATKPAMPTKMAVAMMRGVNAGMADFHYGNNIAMAGGHSFTITVSVNGERTVFRLRMPMHM